MGAHRRFVQFRLLCLELIGLHQSLVHLDRNEALLASLPDLPADSGRPLVQNREEQRRLRQRMSRIIALLDEALQQALAQDLRLARLMVRAGLSTCGRIFNPQRQRYQGLDCAELLLHLLLPASSACRDDGLSVRTRFALAILHRQAFDHDRALLYCESIMADSPATTHPAAGWLEQCLLERATCLIGSADYKHTAMEHSPGGIMTQSLTAQLASRHLAHSVSQIRNGHGPEPSRVLEWYLAARRTPEPQRRVYLDLLFLEYRLYTGQCPADEALRALQELEQQSHRDAAMELEQIMAQIDILLHCPPEEHVHVYHRYLEVFGHFLACLSRNNSTCDRPTLIQGMGTFMRVVRRDHNDRELVNILLELLRRHAPRHALRLAMTARCTSILDTAAALEMAGIFDAAIEAGLGIPASQADSAGLEDLFHTCAVLINIATLVPALNPGGNRLQDCPAGRQRALRHGPTAARIFEYLPMAELYTATALLHVQPWDAEAPAGTLAMDEGMVRYRSFAQVFHCIDAILDPLDDVDLLNFRAGDFQNHINSTVIARSALWHPALADYLESARLMRAMAEILVQTRLEHCRALI